MMQIPLQAIPNQSLTVTLNNVSYNMTIKETNGVMSASITINNVPVQLNSRLASGFLFIPYQYKEQGNGNFFMLTYNGDYPYYTQFGITQTLLYISPEDFLEEDDFDSFVMNFSRTRNFFGRRRER